MSSGSYEGPDRRTSSEYEPRVMSKAELRDTFRETADEVIAGTFKMFGVDVKDTGEVNALRDDLQFARAARLGVNDVTKAARKAAVTALAGVVIGSFLIGFKEKLLRFLGIG